MTGNEIANMYEFSYGAIKRNLDDVTNEESLVQPPGAGNWKRVSSSRRARATA